ncbi:hypothetical protein PGTUg99_010894 [Puccinia graminis f. sp. tritici]|uniref:Uncharacterized protein n=1 Tax=Puccinia graminis f. sp. tritici TaxID=56615 RepID=A0A5B0RWC5_PUCGR|nr:hypothetical protein PGTUg99_010894 [Puccinia graminis f. sp. tritici]
MVYPSLEEWRQNVYAHNNQRRLIPSTDHIEEQKPRVYWKPVNHIGPIPHDAICFSENKMIFSEDSVLLPRTYMIARSECPGGWDFVKSTKTLARYVIDLGHKEYKDPNTFEILCGERDAVQWVRFSSKEGATEGDAIHARAWRPVELGRDSDGRLWFIGLAPKPDILVPGRPLPCKIQDGTNCAIFFDDDSKDKKTRNFQMLVHKNLST